MRREVPMVVRLSMLLVSEVFGLAGHAAVQLLHIAAACIWQAEPGCIGTASSTWQADDSMHACDTQQWPEKHPSSGQQAL